MTHVGGACSLHEDLCYSHEFGELMHVRLQLELKWRSSVELIEELMELRLVELVVISLTGDYTRDELGELNIF